MRRERVAPGLALPLVLTLLALLAACGDSSAEETKGAPPPAAAQQAAATGTPSLSGAAATSGRETPSPAPAAAEPVSTITVVATDNVYAPAAFRVRAGEEVALTLENRGQILHDWRILNLKRADGKDAGTALLTPGQSETITFTIPQAGEYTFYCEVHPVEMRGRLTVQ